ncbi:MAG: imelysin family protein [Candidatus Marinarcus sp.]|uniref:imelysin family protein n=1 Tax=Candidatus Marinarcus sp. TaxID=3100987 RepID=UPI003AFF8041
MKNLKLLISGISVAAALVLSGCTQSNLKEPTESTDIVSTYANIATKNYNDALNDAKLLQTAIYAFTNNPTQTTLVGAKDAWINARESYGQTEIFRLSNGPIDAEEGWIEEAYGAKEGQVNAWPLDENMIDYTIDANGKKTSGNIIDTIGKFNPGGEESKIVDVTTITKDALSDLNENGGEANVSTGYHAIEFLLWGQDQDYSNFIKDAVTHGDMVAGQRPLSDYTTDKYASRRAAYLKAVADKLVDDLTLVASAWENNVDGTKGLYKAALLDKLDKNNSDKNIDRKTALRQIFAGMGVFIKSELANERIAVAVLTPSEEDEHSCFSDNTHRDIAVNYQGFKNALLGEYEGKKYGPAPIDALAIEDKQRILDLMHSIEEKIASVNEVAKTSRHFDRQIISTDPQSKVIVKLKNQMRKLGDEMVTIARANGVDLSVDDVTDSEETKL